MVCTASGRQRTRFQKSMPHECLRPAARVTPTRKPWRGLTGRMVLPCPQPNWPNIAKVSMVRHCSRAVIWERRPATIVTETMLRVRREWRASVAVAAFVTPRMQVSSTGANTKWRLTSTTGLNAASAMASIQFKRPMTRCSRPLQVRYAVIAIAKLPEITRIAL